ncbi:MAG: F0F1 ATP synthase subunit B [Rhodospirillales bacterium]|nr:F0F1 ATP synthase subunit B [Rhodospirillales bacterium]
MQAIFDDPTFWVLVAFVIFVAAFAKPIMRAIAGGLDKRADKIRADLDEAEKLREEAQDLLAAYQRKQRDAAKEAEAIVAHARDESERIAAQGKERIEASLARREQLALDRIGRAEAQALADVRAHAIDVAIEATRSYLANRLKGPHAEKLLESAIKELPKKLN